MKIGNNQQTQLRSQPAFGAIKMVDNISSKEVLEIVTKYQDKLQADYRILFKAKSPLHRELQEYIVNNAKLFGGSPQWLKLNAKYHGIDIADPEKAPLFEFSGNDTLKLALYKLKTSIKSIPYDLREINSEEWQQLPMHLQQIKLMNDFAEKNYSSFNKFLLKHNVQRMNVEEYVESLGQNIDYNL